MFLAVYGGSLFSPALLDDADSTHAEAAREMFASGDYVTLHVNGVRYLEKAPLPYWLVAFSYHIFGVNEFATRLPMAFSVLLLGLLALFWGRRAFGERVGIYAGLFVYTCAGVYLFTRILIPDVLLSLLIAASLFFFVTALEPEGRAWRWYAGYGCIALGVLTKGLIAPSQRPTPRAVGPPAVRARRRTRPRGLSHEPERDPLQDTENVTRSVTETGSARRGPALSHNRTVT